MQFKIENMSCRGCARAVTQAIQSVDPAAKVDADPAARIVKVDTTASTDALNAALERAGFDSVAVQQGA